MWMCIVFGKLDARSLGLCCCVSRAWRLFAEQEELWRCLCAASWPGILASEWGRDVVRVSGGYRRFYSSRRVAAAKLSGRRRIANSASGKPPRLKFRELLFLLDVHYKDSPVCSVVRGSEALKPMFAPAVDADEEHGIFRFVVEVPVGLSSCSWQKCQMKEFSISWAVMVKGNPTVFQILHTREGGQVVGNTCNYSQRLPTQSCCCCGCSSESNHVAEVDLYFSISCEDKELFFLRELRCSFLNTDCWRYFSLPQALRYLQHALLHESHHCFL